MISVGKKPEVHLGLEKRIRLAPGELAGWLSPDLKATLQRIHLLRELRLILAAAQADSLLGQWKTDFSTQKSETPHVL